jgi:hypothetical protein
MERLKAFKSLKKHAWLGRIYHRLTPAELAIAEAFIALHGSLSATAYEQAIHRMFLDQPKPKHFSEIMELLLCSK